MMAASSSGGFLASATSYVAKALGVAGSKKAPVKGDNLKSISSAAAVKRVRTSFSVGSWWLT